MAAQQFDWYDRGELSSGRTALVQPNQRRARCPFCGGTSTHVVKLGPVPADFDSDWNQWRVFVCGPDGRKMVAYQSSKGIPARIYRYRG